MKFEDYYPGNFLTKGLPKRAYACFCCQKFPSWHEKLSHEGQRQFFQALDYLFSIFSDIHDQYEIFHAQHWAYRCERANRKVHGAKYSPHLLGVALDVDTMDPKQNKELAEYIAKHYTNIRVIVKQYQYEWVHFDVAPHLPLEEMVRLGIIPANVAESYSQAFLL